MQRRVVRARALAVLVLLIGAASVGGCSADDEAPANAESSTKTIGAEGGSVGTAGVRLTVPAGALPSDTTISVTASDQPPSSEHEALSKVFRFAPEGLVFAKPVTIQIEFEGNATGAAIFWSAATGPGFDEVTSTRFADQFATGEITHFSLGFVGRRKHATPPPGQTDAGAATDAATATDAIVSVTDATASVDTGVNDSATTDSAPTDSATASDATSDAATDAATDAKSDAKDGAVSDTGGGQGCGSSAQCAAGLVCFNGACVPQGG